MATAVLNAPPGFEWIRRVSGWLLVDNELTVTAETSAGDLVRIILGAVAPTIWRVQLLPGQISLPELPLVIARPASPIPLNVGETGQAIHITGPSLSLEIGRNPFCLTWREAGGRVVCRENPFDVDGLNRLFVLPLGYGRDEQGAIAWTNESFHLWPDEHLFGLGEKFTPLDKTRQKIVSWTLDALGAASERAYKNIPLLLSTRGYGLFINTGRRIEYDLGSQSCETYTFRIEGPTLDIYLIYGPSPAEILEQYSGLTGRAPLPPKWSFGLWLSGCGVYRDEATIRELAIQANAHEIPCDVIHIDPWWMRWRKYADFTWDREAFPDPEKLILDLHLQGLRLSAWQHPYISVESELFTLGKQKAYFAIQPNGEVYVIDYGLSLSTLPGGVTQIASANLSWNAPVAIIDLTNPHAVTWYKSLMRGVLKMGLDVFKTDFGEDIPVDACFANGMTGAEMHNIYPLLYNQVVFEVTQEVKGAGIVWARSAYAGSQRYPTCWSGDPACTWDSLAFTIRGGLSLGMSGIPFWSNDIGGYRGHPSEALYIRWAQFGLLCSHARCHGESQREPWSFGERALKIFRQYAQLRYRLFPYLYSCAHEATNNGLPLLRAMPLSFPNDPNSYDKDLQFMLGPWLLIAPIYSEDGRRSIYLPAGDWVDFWSDAPLTGPLNLDVQPPLEQMPIYVRSGAIIPMMQPALRIPQRSPDPLILEVYLGDPSTYHFYEDEGVTDFRLSAEEDGWAFGWSGGLARKVITHFHQGRQPAAVKVQALNSGSSQHSQ